MKLGSSELPEMDPHRVSLQLKETWLTGCLVGLICCFFKGTVCPRTCSQQRLRFESQDVVKEKKNHLIGMMRKHKRHFTPPTVFQPCTLLHFICLVCWSCCKISGVGTLLSFVFAVCFVQCIPFPAGSCSLPLW